MKVTCTLLVVASMLGFFSGARAQDSPGVSATPAASSKTQGGDVLWYGKAPPGWGGVVGSMKQLAPGVGWANRGGHFYWTTDNGANWTDITPPNSPDVRVDAGAGSPYDLFFLDTHRGWALVAGCGTDNPKKLDLELGLLSTTDSGATWSKIPMTPIALSDYGNPDGVNIVGCGANFAFADSLHGWINVTARGETMNTFGGTLLVTSDGGRTWTRAAKDPRVSFAEILMLSPNDGWLFGTETDEMLRSEDYQLYVTHDGTRSWQKITLGAPKEIAPADCSVHDLPIFEDTKHGFLQMNCMNNKNGKYRLNLVLFATEDGGRTWKEDRMVANLDDSDTRNQYASSAVVGSDWIFAASSDHHPVLTKIGPGARTDATADAASSRTRYGEIDSVSFATAADGWAIVGDGYLMSTVDGGTTWTALTPGPQPHVIQPHGSFIPRQPMQSPTAATSRAGPRSANDSFGQTANPSKHLGFEVQHTGSTTEMQAWWNYSPYHDVGVYLNLTGTWSTQLSNNGCQGSAIGLHNFPDEQLDNPNWVNTVTGYGWGLMPLWGGPQAGAVTRYGKKAICQGKAQADRAALSAQTAGILPGGIIYYDMEENPKTSSVQVQQFLIGWVQELHANGYSAGVYVSGSNAKVPASMIQRPDAAWIAAPGPPHVASIWGLASYGGFDDMEFPNHQRIRQFDNGPGKGIPKVTWGSTGMNAFFNGGAQVIDLDIEDAPVVGGGGTKPIQVYGEYPFSVFADCTGPDGVISGLPCNVVANGINNPDLNTTETIGNIVGEINEFPGGGIFIPSKDVQVDPLADQSCGSYLCPVNCDPYMPNLTSSFQWGFTTGYLQKGPIPPPGYLQGPAAQCFWWNPNPGPPFVPVTVGVGINNLTGSSGAIVGYTSLNDGSAYQGCETPSQNPGTCNQPFSEQSPVGQEYIGINDVGWISEESAPDNNAYSTISLVVANGAGVATIDSGYFLSGGGINGFGQVAYYYYDSTHDTVNSKVFDYNPSNPNSPDRVSMQGPVVGINNNNDAVTSDVTLIQDADTATGSAIDGVPVGCPQMDQASGINDWGQIVGSATVATDLPFVGNGVVSVGDVCIPYTGN
jgi:photosystem II stability/assembly factor-like uncharacterized protein